MMESGLAKVTVVLTPAAFSALGRAMSASGRNRDHAVNRAVMAYADLVAAAETGGGRFTYETRAGELVEVLVRPARRRWRRPTKRRLGLCAAVLVYLAVVALVVIFMF